MEPMAVTPGDLDTLAAGPEQAATFLGNAAVAADGIGASVWLTHGLICGTANAAVNTAEDVRRDAVVAVQKAVQQLAGDLHAAADAYTGTDQRSGEDLEPRIG